MALPENYNPYEHLQDVVRRTHNREVREAFSDLGIDDWEPNISGTRSSLRQACTIHDNDTSSMILMRQNLFFLTMRRARDYQAPIVGMPKESLDSIRKYRPQICLFFKEDSEDVDPDYEPITGRISFRLMDEDSETITESKLKGLANKIKLELGANKGYIWKKGKHYFSYTDKNKGYQLQILALNEITAKDLIQKVLAIQNHNMENKRFNQNTNKDPTRAFPTIPPSIRILNETKKEPRRRPVGDVRFQYAIANIWGQAAVVPLFDRTFTYPKALVTDF